VSEKKGWGVTPRKRVEHLVEHLGQALPPPPNRSDWLRTKYNVVIRKLNVKSGVSIHAYDFKGDNLVGLINRFGQRTVEVFFDPEDYRRAYVDVDNNLIELTNVAASEFSPAYTFAYAKKHRAQLKKAHATTERQTASRDARLQRSAEKSKPKSAPKRALNRGEKKQVVQRTKEREAVSRAEKHPLNPSKPKTGSSTDAVPMQWGDAGELSTRDRKTGALV